MGHQTPRPAGTRDAEASAHLTPEERARKIVTENSIEGDIPNDRSLDDWGFEEAILDISEAIHASVAEAKARVREDELERIIEVLRPEYPDAIATIRARTALRGVQESVVTLETGSHAGCNYLARPGTVCMKCGQYHPGNKDGR